MKIKKDIHYFNIEIEKLKEKIDNTTDEDEKKIYAEKIKEYQAEISKLKFSPKIVGTGGRIYRQREESKDDKRKGDD